MTHEFKEIIQAYQKAKQQEMKAVIATVVKVEGSSYRRPGVQMLILENGNMIGAVSGGCVEKEVKRQAQSVIRDGIPKVMTYDGRYRLGCEGILYILIEKLDLSNSILQKIEKKLASRTSFFLRSNFSTNPEEVSAMGSFLEVDNEKLFFSGQKSISEHKNTFAVELKSCFRLVIIGAEHDAVKLCDLASLTGWEVIVIASPKDPKRLIDFPGARKIKHETPEEFESSLIDNETAVMLMTHNFAKDLLYLKAIKNKKPVYVGLLGPAKRREKILNAFIDYFPDVSDEFLQLVHGPAGLNIGAETPQEIAISIIAEILSVIRNQDPIHLQHKKGAIHTTIDNTKLDVIAGKS